MVVSHYLFSLSQPLKSSNGANGVCAYCGQAYPDMLPLNQVTSERYTNWDLHKEKESLFICRPCAEILTKPEYRRTNVLAEKSGVRFLKRKRGEGLEEIVDALFYRPLTPPFVVSLPSDYKKHIIMRCPVNYCTKEFFVQYGEETIRIIPDKHRELYEKMLNLKNLKVTRSQIQKGIIPKKVEKALGEERAQEIKVLLNEYNHTPIFELINELTRKEDDENDKDVQVED